MNEYEDFKKLEHINSKSSIKKLSWASLAGALIIPPAGIIFGHIALYRIIKQKPFSRKYLWLTIGGLALGYASTVTLALMIGGIPALFEAALNAAQKSKGN